MVNLDVAVCMWTLASNMKTEWTPRTCLRTQEEQSGAAQADTEVGFRDGKPTPLMLVLLGRCRRSPRPGPLLPTRYHGSCRQTGVARRERA